jgi:hypothetical protein
MTIYGKKRVRRTLFHGLQGASMIGQAVHFHEWRPLSGLQEMRSCHCTPCPPCDTLQYTQHKSDTTYWRVYKVWILMRTAKIRVLTVTFSCHQGARVSARILGGCMRTYTWYTRGNMISLGVVVAFGEYSLRHVYCNASTQNSSVYRTSKGCMARHRRPSFDSASQCRPLTKC